MKKIMHLLFLSCLKATELIEKKFHFKLSWTEKMQLKAHKMMCNACATYEKQSAIIEQGISKVNKKEFTEGELEQLKKRIYQKLGNLK
ncbi:MAG: hypothetical protein P1P88_13935 [Bacteroidales bacterium]|nr:hypothetical protein [Bacteroidales bacterium]